MKPRKKIISEEPWPQLMDISPTLLAFLVFTRFQHDHIARESHVDWGDPRQISGKIDHLPSPTQKVIQRMAELISFLTFMDRIVAEELDDSTDKLDELDFEYFGGDEVRNLLFMTMVAYAKRHAPKLAKETYGLWKKRKFVMNMEDIMSGRGPASINLIPNFIRLALLDVEIALTKFERWKASHGPVR